jgi:hypothetical protein
VDDHASRFIHDQQIVILKDNLEWDGLRDQGAGLWRYVYDDRARFRVLSGL